MLKKKQIVLLLSLLLITYLPISLCNTIEAANSQSKAKLRDLLHWGSYKPNLYSAITERSKQPITVGMAYSDTLLPKPKFETFQKELRYEVQKDITTHYTYNNGFDFNRQLLIDRINKVKYDMAFFKNELLPNQKDPLSVAQNWVYYIQAQQNEQKQQQQSSQDPFYTFLYIDLENYDQSKQDYRELKLLNDPDGGDSTIVQVWNTKTAQAEGYFRITVINHEEVSVTGKRKNIRGIFKCLDYYNDAKTKNITRSIYDKLSTDIFKGQTYLDPILCQKDNEDDKAHLFMLQVVSEQRVDIIVSYNSAEIPVIKEMKQIIPSIITKQRQFEEMLLKQLPIKNLNKFKYPLHETREIQRIALSDLIGGIFYGYGTIKGQKYDDFNKNNTVVIADQEVFGITPTRYSYKRAFAWDEGFHLTVLCSWNTTLCIEILSGWLGLNANNDIFVKEMIYGDQTESEKAEKDEETLLRSEVEAPSLLLPLTKLVDLYKDATANDKTTEKATEIKEFLEKALPKVKKWFTGFEKRYSQDGKYFRWHQNKPANSTWQVASGLHDYPRDAIDSEVSAHLDLHVWFLTFARTLSEMDKVLIGEQNESYESKIKSLLDSLKEFHDSSDGLLKDIITHNAAGSEKFSVSKGYVNLFPVFVGALDKVDPIIDLLSKEEKLWSSYGIRSLAEEDEKFLEGDNHWNEPISIAFNYLLLRGLKNYYHDNNDIKELYQAIRGNLVKLVANNWRINLQLWERYDSYIGMGKGKNGYSGWSSLIALIYAEEY